MRKWVLLFVVLVACFAYVNRERLYVRDPLGTVARDGVKEAGAQVYVNYSNDVLLENDNPPAYFNLVQRGEPVVAPETLKCFHYLVCLADDRAANVALAVPGAKVVSMTAREVVFRDGAGREARVKLR